jgi:hypothetical protein
MEYTAELRDWSIIQMGKYSFAFGAIFHDSRGRFPDGELVRTSAIKSRDADMVITRNSTYKLIGEERK